RVIGNPVQQAGLLIEVTLASGPMRAEMLDYGLRLLLMSALVALVLALLLLLAVRRFVLLPMRQVVRAMIRYGEAPEDARRIHSPAAAVAELREAEVALTRM